MRPAIATLALLALAVSVAGPAEALPLTLPLEENPLPDPGCVPSGSSSICATCGIIGFAPGPHFDTQLFCPW